MKRTVAALLLVGILAGCGGAAAPVAPPAVQAPIAPASTKYTQTWPKGYDVTPCSDWRDVMDNHQRFVAAGDFLTTLRKKDGDGSLPSDQMISAFALDMSDMCAAPVGQVATILDLAPLVYLAFPAEFKP